MEDSNSKKRVRGDSAESDLDSPMVKRLRDDLLDLLEDSDSFPVNQDLASVIKSFEEEISAASSTSNAKEPLLNPKSDSSEPQPDLVYLLEASDDDLGLPPPMATTTSSDEIRSEITELLRLDTHSSGTGELWEFGDQIHNFDLFGFGIGDNYGGGHVTYGGLFEYPDVYYDSSEFSALLWRPETLSAE